MNVQAHIFFSNCAPAPANTLHHYLATKCDEFEKYSNESRLGTVNPLALKMAKEVDHLMKKCWTFSLATGIPMTFFYFDKKDGDRFCMVKKSLSVRDSDFFEEEEIYYISESEEAEFIIVSHYDENPSDFFTVELTDLLISV